MRNEMPRTFVGSTAFTVTGMTCEHCRKAVIDAIRHIAGVDAVSLDLESGSASVTASSPVDRADIAAAVASAGHALRS